MATLYVPSGLYPTIQDAMDDAGDNDIIEIADGTYNESHLRWNGIFGPDNVTIRGAAGADVKIHATSTSYDVFSLGVVIASGTTIENLEIKTGHSGKHAVAAGTSAGLTLRNIRVPADNPGSFFSAERCTNSTVEKCVVLGGITGISRTAGSGLLVRNTIIRVSDMAWMPKHATDRAYNCTFIKTGAYGRCIEMQTAGTARNVICFKEGAAGTSVGINLGHEDADVDYCTCYGFATPFDEASADAGEHCNEVDPDFDNPGAYDYHLPADSPCVDTGETLVAVPDDLDGIERPQGLAFDRGAYEFPDADPPEIDHDPVEDDQPVYQDVLVEAVVTDEVSNVDAVALFYRLKGETDWTELPMAADGDNYSATIPGDDVDTPVVEYYIWAVDDSPSANEATHPVGAPTEFHSFTVASGVEDISPEDSRTVRVRFISLPGTNGPRRAVRRDAYTVSQGGKTRVVGRPRLDAEEPYDVLVPVATPWIGRGDITVTVDAHDANGGEYSAPAAGTCRGLPETSPLDVGPESIRQRDDLLSDRTTGELQVSAGTYKHHWGYQQLMKTAQRIILDDGPFGISIRKDAPQTRREVERLRLALYNALRAQPGVLQIEVTASSSMRADGVLAFKVRMLTPQGWFEEELPLNVAQE